MKKLLILGAASLFVFSSCEKAIQDVTETADSAQDFAQDQQVITAMSDMMQDISSTENFFQKKSSSIVPLGVIDYVDTSYSDGDGIEIVLDFGTTGTLLGNGWTMKGTYKISSNNIKLSESGGFIKLEQTSTNGEINKVGFTYAMNWDNTHHVTVTNQGTDKYNVTYNMHLGYTEPGKDPVNLNPTGDITVTQTEGQDVDGVEDDTYVISGQTVSQNHNGTQYTVTITEDLVRKADQTCSKTFISGNTELKNDGSSSSLKVNFGDGTCDNDIVITLPGGIEKTYTVK